MKVLLDTNIIIHREANRVINKDIGILFNWLDRLKYQKCIHPLSIEEIKSHEDKKIVETMRTKIQNYNLLKTIAPETTQIQKIRKTFDKSDNDEIDTSLLKEVFSGRVNYLISEDLKIHLKAKTLGISDRIFTINSFIDKVMSDNPDLIDYKTLSIRKKYFGEININDLFFQNFREEYIGFEKWFLKKSDEIAYVCYDKERITAFLYLKVENEDENYSDIHPILCKKKRLKISTFKVTCYGLYLGERLLKIIFDNALQYKVNEIYVTIFDNNADRILLIKLLETWGFRYHGIKYSDSGKEKVYIRNFERDFIISDPKLSFPYISKNSRVFIVPIYPAYHTELFPDSILRTESPNDFVENEPHRNAISKAYISHSHERELKTSDIILFYRTGGYYLSVVTTIGIVENIIIDIKDETDLIKKCKKRSVLSDKQLTEFWYKYPTLKPFIVNFLYCYSFPKRPNLKRLIEIGVIPGIHDAPRGFTRISLENFYKIVKEANVDESIIVD